MPKINAPAVAEHRAQQREALIGVAIDLLVNEGAAAVTPAAVGARAGLARSSVYQYFDSSAALLATITEEAFRRSNEALAGAMATAGDPVERVEAFFRESLRLGAEGAHRPAEVLMGAGLPPACQERLMELHLEQVEPFRASVREIGVPDPLLTADLIAGMLHSALSAVDRGAPLDTVTDHTLELVRRCLSPAGTLEDRPATRWPARATSPARAEASGTGCPAGAVRDPLGRGTSPDEAVPGRCPDALRVAGAAAGDGGPAGSVSSVGDVSAMTGSGRSSGHGRFRSDTGAAGARECRTGW